MIRIAFRSTWMLVAAFACWSLLLNGFVLTEQAQAQTRQHREPGCLPKLYGQPDLFRNYYEGLDCDDIPAELYPAPHPVPAWVGQTFYTYQPLMPHEFLHRHSRRYHRYYNFGRGLNRTKVNWW